jgi:prephenate dehydrogenase
MSTENIPEFSNALIVGTGLIGTSIGIRLSEQGVAVGLQDTDLGALDVATQRGAGRPHIPGDTYDLAVIAVPPSEVIDVVGRILETDTAKIVTDVASTKQRIAAEALRACIDPNRFVPSHPMAGREITGPRAAQRDLFEGKVWAITPLPGSERKVVRTIEVLIVACGAIAIETNPEVHDTSVALVSHVPHLISATLAAELRGDEEALALTGTGLPGMVRLAGGSPDLWANILATNAGPVLGRLHSFREQLDGLIAGMEAAAQGDQEALKERLHSGVAGKTAMEQVISRRNTPGSTDQGVDSSSDVTLAALEVARS